MIFRSTGSLFPPVTPESEFDVSTITAGSGTIHLKGEGGVGSNPIAILGSSNSSTIGSGTETIILDSLLGSVTILNLISSNQLQDSRDSTGAESVAFIAANLSNSVSEISALGNGSNGRIGSSRFPELGRLFGGLVPQREAVIHSVAGR